MPNPIPPIGFHNLPAETRNHIYGYCSPSVAFLAYITGKMTILERVGTGARYTVKSLNILQLDRKTRTEAAAFLADKCPFAINLRWQLETSFEAIFGQNSRGMRNYDDNVLLPDIRNWLIDLKWDSKMYGNSQPRDFKRLLECVVKVLYKNEGTNSVTIKHPCACAIKHGGFNVLDTTARNNPVVRRSQEKEGHRAVFDMLEPLARFQASKAVTFVPTVVQTSPPWNSEKPCEKKFCHRLTNGIKEIMGKSRSPRKAIDLRPARRDLGIDLVLPPLEYTSEVSRQLQMENRARLCGHL